jgi:hypothetical protein
MQALSSFTDVLLTLQGMIGQPVHVVIRSATGDPPDSIAYFWGGLGGDAGDRLRLSRDRDRESAKFAVGFDDPDVGAIGYFTVSEAALREAFVDGDKLLIHSGDVWITIIPKRMRDRDDGPDEA